jgi:hypothetical protein
LVDGYRDLEGTPRGDLAPPIAAIVRRRRRRPIRQAAAAPFCQAQDSAFLASVRTEEHCRRCGGRFGHIFDDGPPPTGKRHGLNGLALYFIAA